MNHKQEARGEGNKIIHFNPAHYNRSETNNIYSRDDMTSYLREKLKMVGIVTIIILQILMLIIIIVGATRQADFIHELNSYFLYSK